MSIIFHIFVVLVTCIMDIQENINAPEISESLLHGAGCKPLVGGAPYFATMKMIEDLGMLPFCNGKYRKHYAIYECPFCGKHFRTSLNLVHRGETKSCGCYKILFGKIKFTKHKLTKTRIYSIWSALKQRCYYKKGESYAYYGNRGIKVCEEWRNDFITFHTWAINNGYNDSLYIDRENVNGNYEPSNCRWVTNYVNGQNTRLLKIGNTSGYRGVCFRFNKWIAQIHSNGKQYHLGMFKTPIEAAITYDNFVIQNKTEHPLNFPERQKDGSESSNK